MKRLPLFILILAAAIGIAATTHDYFLLPENFFLHKGDVLNLHLLAGDQFVKQEEVRYQPKKIASFILYEGKKKTDLTKVAKDSASPIVNYTMLNTGQSLIAMTSAIEYNNSSRDSYAEFLTDQGLDKMAEKVKNSNQFRVKEKSIHYLKTLFSVDDHDGNAHEKDLNEEFEIILKDDPYDKKYGDDMVAQLKFQGKPDVGATVTLYIKSTSGNVYTKNFTTDKHGEITLTMTREGIFMLRSVRVDATKDKDADYASWWTSFTFPFSSSNEMPNTYKEFGFGDIH
jgi:uncharacterized GH25 family protein